MIFWRFLMDEHSMFSTSSSHLFIFSLVVKKMIIWASKFWMFTRSSLISSENLPAQRMWTNSFSFPLATWTNKTSLSSESSASLMTKASSLLDFSLSSTTKKSWGIKSFLSKGWKKFVSQFSNFLTYFMIDFFKLALNHEILVSWASHYLFWIVRYDLEEASCILTH